MKHNNLSVIVVWVVSGFLTPASGQNLKDDLKAINLAYQRLSSLAMDVTYKVFASWEDKNAIQTETGMMKKLGKMTYNKIGSMESVQNPEYTLVVDHDEKTIGIMGVFGEPAEENFEEILSGIETMLNRCEEIKHKNLNNNRGQYELILPDRLSEYKKIALVYYKDTHLLSGLTLYYAQEQDITEDNEEQPPRIEITYSNIKRNISIPPDFFTYEKFLKKSGSRLECLEKYRHYQLDDKYSKK